MIGGIWPHSQDIPIFAPQRSDFPALNPQHEREVPCNLSTVAKVSIVTKSIEKYSST